MEDFGDDTVCKVMEMLNFSVISNEKLKELSKKDGSAPFTEQQNKENEKSTDAGFHDNGHQQQPQSLHQKQGHVGSHYESDITIVKERELAYQCMMLGTDLFIEREENDTISKRLISVMKENDILKEDLSKVNGEKAKLGKELCKVKEEKAKLSKKLSEAQASTSVVENDKLNLKVKRKLIQVEARLLKQEVFSTELQFQVKTFLSALAKVVEKDGGKLNLESDKIEMLLKLLMEINGKIPVYVLKDWDETKAVFKKLNRLFITETASTTGSRPNSPEKEIQSSPKTPTTEVSTTTASPPARDEGEDNNGNNDNSNDDTSTTVNDDVNEDILILEENVSSTRPSVVITRTTVPKTPAAAAASANHSNVCVFCGVKYANSELLVEHLAIIHKGCLLCKISFANQEMLNRHIQFTHHYWQPESQPIPVSKSLTTHPSPTANTPNKKDRPPLPPFGEISKTQSKTNNSRPTPSYQCTRSKRPQHGMVSSDPKDVWNKCLCGYAFMSKKELCMHILSNNNANGIATNAT